MTFRKILPRFGTSFVVLCEIRNGWWDGRQRCQVGFIQLCCQDSKCLKKRFYETVVSLFIFLVWINVFLIFSMTHTMASLNQAGVVAKPASSQRRSSPKRKPSFKVMCRSRVFPGHIYCYISKTRIIIQNFDLVEVTRWRHLPARGCVAQMSVYWYECYNYYFSLHIRSKKPLESRELQSTMTVLEYEGESLKVLKNKAKGREEQHA